MIVDSHLHLFSSGYGHFTQSGFPFPGVSDVDAYEGLRGGHSIGAGLVVCYEAEGIDPSNNAYVRSLAVNRPWIHSVAYLEPLSKPGVDQIAGLLSAGHCGITLYLPDAAAVEALDSWPSETWRLLSDAGAIVSLNARPEATQHLRRLIGRAGGCQFLFSHLGLPGRYEIAPAREEAAQRLAALLELATFPNVAVKLSGFYAVDPVPLHATAQPFVELLLERFGSSNLHWGSDFSPVLDYVSFDAAIDPPHLSALSPDERASVMGASLAAKLSDSQRKRAAGLSR